jgi:hypothetical protein
MPAIKELQLRRRFAALTIDVSSVQCEHAWPGQHTTPAAAAAAAIHGKMAMVSGQGKRAAMRRIRLVTADALEATRHHRCCS